MVALDVGVVEMHGPATSAPGLWPRPVGLGLLGAAGLLGFYLGVISLAQGWNHAVQQLSDDRWFVGAIMAGFGTQVGLFTYLRGLHARLSGGGVAASTGTSTAAMLACCAHHLTDVAPLLGLVGVVGFLSAYKAPMLWLGIGMNVLGIMYLAGQVRRQRRHIRDGQCAVGTVLQGDPGTTEEGKQACH